MSQYKPPRRGWTEAEDSRLRRDYPEQDTSELAARMQRSDRSLYNRADFLGLKKSERYLADKMARLIESGVATRLQTGNAGPIKRSKGLAPDGEQSRHGTGSRPYNWRPIGSERVSRDGYRYRKIRDEVPSYNNYRAVHVLVWEAQHGPVPRGHAVVFKDGNPDHIALDNLELITGAELMRRNSVHRYPPELKHVMRLNKRLQRLIDQRAKGGRYEDPE